MTKAMNSQAYETLREGMKEGLDIAWKQGKQGMETAWKQGKRVHLRSPWTYDQPSGWRTRGWIGLACLSMAALAVGTWLYFRKRKAVANHYTMGQGPDQTWAPGQNQVDGQVASVGTP